MDWIEIINFLPNSVGFMATDLILLITILGSIILFAKDFKVGLISLVMLLSLEFIIFSILGLEVYRTLTLLLVSIVLLALSLYTSNSKTGGLN